MVVFAVLILRMSRNKRFSINMQIPKIHESEQDRGFANYKVEKRYLRSTDFPELTALGVIAYREAQVSDAAIAVQSLGTIDWTPTVDVIECAFLQSLDSSDLVEKSDTF